MTDVGDLLARWTQARRDLAELERAEHPDLVDKYGRTWVWKSGDVYFHDDLAWTRNMIEDGRYRLPPAALADNPNYNLCDICTCEWPTEGST